MIVVQEYERLFGVNATDGSLLWEAGVPLARRGRRFMYVEAIPLIAGLERHPGETWPRVRGQHTETESATAPRIAFVLGDVTVVRPASLASGVGTVTSAAVRPVLAPARDPRRLRPLPWVVRTSTFAVACRSPSMWGGPAGQPSSFRWMREVPEEGFSRRKLRRKSRGS